MINRLLYLILIAACILSCVERVELEIDNGPDLLVVEGGISNDEGPYELKLSLTTPFSTNPSLFGRERYIQGAEVYVIDVNSNSFTQMKMVQDGYYYTPSSFRGKVGHSYYLQISWNDKIYESSIQEIKPSPEIDSIYYNQILGSDEIGIFVDFLDNEEKNEFYRWKWEGYYQMLTRLPGPPNYPDTFDCCNVCYIPAKGLSTNLLEDRLINSNKVEKHLIASVPINEPTGPTDFLINVKQLKISEKEFNFWNLVKEQEQSDGGLFSPLPSRLIGNINNINNEDEFVLGYFSVAGIKESSIKIKRGNYSNKVVYFGPPDTFDCRSLNPNATILKPDNWD